VTFTSVVHYDILCVLLFYCIHVCNAYAICSIKVFTYLLTTYSSSCVWDVCVFKVAGLRREALICPISAII